MEACEIGDEAITHLTCLAHLNAPMHLFNLRGNRFSEKGRVKVETLFGAERVDLSTQS